MSRLLLHKQQFFHSHRAQPMALDQVLSEKDSEEKVDNDVADIEDRRKTIALPRRSILAIGESNATCGKKLDSICASKTLCQLVFRSEMLTGSFTVSSTAFRYNFILILLSSFYVCRSVCFIVNHLLDLVNLFVVCCDILYEFFFFVCIVESCNKY